MRSASRARVQIATGDDLDVRSFSVKQHMSELFRVELRVVSSNPSVELAEVIGNDASFSLSTEWASRSFSGVCIEMEQVRVDARGLATYTVVIAPRAWLMTQRTNYRIFQYESELDIVKKLLGEWGVEHEARVDSARHKARKFRVQYHESDFAFACRMLEDAGISFYFEPSEDGTKLVLDDDPQSRELAHPLLVYRDSPGVTDGRFVTRVALLQRVRPSRVTIGDLEYRRASTNQPRLSAAEGLLQEQRLERFDYEPGAFHYVTGVGGASPTADDRGTARTDEVTGAMKTRNRLLALRQGAKRIRFETNVVELSPGSILSVLGHPHRMVSAGTGLLTVGTLLSGDHDGEWQVHAEAVPTTLPYRPELRTPKPVVQGLESATVVGPLGEEIHTDEYGRVRVHFHWDRESKRDQSSSCWLPTSQPWAGTGFGGVNIPRIGQEVLVEFLNADPDRPVVIGRVYTETNPVPDKLPRYKNVSGLMSESTPRIVMGAADGGPGAAAPTSPLGGGTPLGASELNELVTGSEHFRAASPTGSNHSWNGSGFKMDDSDGAQVFYLQAQRDFNVVVRNAWRTIVANRRGCIVGTDDQLTVWGAMGTLVRRDQRVDVEGDQELRVTYDRAESVTRNLTWVVGSGGVHIKTETAPINYRARRQLRLTSLTKIELVVGNSTIVVEPSRITVEAAQAVWLQPREGAGPRRR
jgi:type VI secretion system secreted protein VgrG